ncbi:MAG: cytidine deaminase [Acidobacteria bacterium]|nr:cytidine deaminase [Acidobacteriota bacterium]
MNEDEERELIVAAREGRDYAIAPYSGFRVGAALRSSGGETFRGCNVENASYGLTMCAERVALYSALAKGVRDFDAVAVVTEADPPSSPCGPCRQLLWEYCGDIEVVMASVQSKETVRQRLSELLPNPFELKGEETS